eukprot:TRINITY_DN11925_c0_g1_i1.p1 TRINITY_DN11925_c0_g1~~TRINITY_DN11925_c0_g1_i1.p1  ORF type:complete len:1762 (+),score=470.37 TRINITY_DN11925_c0_g1_i1:82-5367(+)
MTEADNSSLTSTGRGHTGEEESPPPAARAPAPNGPGSAPVSHCSPAQSDPDAADTAAPSARGASAQARASPAPPVPFSALSGDGIRADPCTPMQRLRSTIDLTVSSPSDMARTFTETARMRQGSGSRAGERDPGWDADGKGGRHSRASSCDRDGDECGGDGRDGGGRDGDGASAAESAAGGKGSCPQEELVLPRRASTDYLARDADEERRTRVFLRSELLRLREDLRRKDEVIHTLREREAADMASFRERMQQELHHEAQRVAGLAAQLAEREAELAQLRQDQARESAGHARELAEARLGGAGAPPDATNDGEECRALEKRARLAEERALAAEEALHSRSDPEMAALREAEARAREEADQLRQQVAELQQAAAAAPPVLAVPDPGSAVPAALQACASPRSPACRSALAMVSGCLESRRDSTSSTPPQRAACPELHNSWVSAMTADSAAEAAEVARKHEQEVSELRQELAKAARADEGNFARRLRQANDAIERAADPAAQHRRSQRAPTTLEEELGRSEALADVIVHLRRDICRDAAQHRSDLDDAAQQARRLRRANDAIDRVLAVHQSSAARHAAPSKSGDILSAEVQRAERVLARLEKLQRDLADEREATAAAQNAAVLEAAARARAVLEVEQLRRELSAKQARLETERAVTGSDDPAITTPTATALTNDSLRRRAQSLHDARGEVAELRKRAAAWEDEAAQARIEAAQSAREVAAAREREAELLASLQQETDLASAAQAQLERAQQALAEARRQHDEDEARLLQQLRAVGGAAGDTDEARPGSPQPEDDIALLQELRSQVRDLAARLREEQEARRGERKRLQEEAAEAAALLQQERALRREEAAAALEAAKSARQSIEESRQALERAEGEAAAAAGRLRRANQSMECTLSAAAAAQATPKHPRSGFSSSSTDTAGAADLTHEVVRCEALAQSAADVARDVWQRSDAAEVAEAEVRRLRKANDALDRVLAHGADGPPAPTSHELSDEVRRVELLLPRAERLQRELAADKEAAGAAQERFVREAAARARLTLELDQARKQLGRVAREFDLEQEQHERELVALRGELSDSGSGDTGERLRQELLERTQELTELRKEIRQLRARPTTPPSDLVPNGSVRAGAAAAATTAVPAAAAGRESAWGHTSDVASSTTPHPDDECGRLRAMLAERAAAAAAHARRLQQAGDGIEGALRGAPTRTGPRPAEMDTELSRLEGLAWRAAEELRAQSRSHSDYPSPGWVDAETRRLRRAIGALERAAECEPPAHHGPPDTDPSSALPAAVTRVERVRARVEQLLQRMDEEQDRLRAELEKRASAAEGEAEDVQDQLRQCRKQLDEARGQLAAATDTCAAQTAQEQRAAAQLREISDALDVAAEGARTRGSPRRARGAPVVAEELARAEALAAHVQAQFGALRREHAADAAQLQEALALAPRLRRATDVLTGLATSPRRGRPQLSEEVERLEQLAHCPQRAASSSETAGTESASAPVDEERRIDPADGGSYTLREFVDCYGAGGGLSRWSSAPRDRRGLGSPEPPRSQGPAEGVSCYMGMDVSEGVLLVGAGGRPGRVGAAGGPVRVSSVAAGGPAERAGVRRGDAILELAGSAITSRESFREAARRIRPGESAALLVRRADAPGSVALRICTQQVSEKAFVPGANRRTERRTLSVLHLRPHQPRAGSAATGRSASGDPAGQRNASPRPAVPPPRRDAPARHPPLARSASAQRGSHGHAENPGARPSALTNGARRRSGSPQRGPRLALRNPMPP